MKRKIDVPLGGSSSSSGSSRARVGNFSDEETTINYWTQQPFSARYYEILTKRKALPVYEFKQDLEEKVRDNQIVIIEGETGSGKTLAFGIPLMEAWHRGGAEPNDRHTAWERDFSQYM